MNVEPVDLGHELRQRVQSRLDLAPILLFRPMAREFLHRRELSALRAIKDSLAVGPPSRLDASMKINERFLGNAVVEGLYRGIVSRCGKLLRQQADGARGS
jgi:hypothetical protein